MQKIFKFCEVFTKEDNFENKWFSLFCYISINLITSLETVSGWRHAIIFVMNTLKTGKNMLFWGYFSEAP